MDKKIKVALMSYSMDNRTAKGTAIYTKELINNLIPDENFEFALIHYEKTDNPLYKKTREIIIPKFIYPSRFLRQLYFFWLYRKDKFDIIHWFQPRVYPGYWWAPAKHKVVTLHGGEKYSYPKFSISARMFEWVLHYVNKYIDYFIVGTVASRKESSERFNIDVKLIETTYYGGSEKFIPLNKASSFFVVNKVHPQISGDFILTVSRLQPHKNINNLVRAYIHMRDGWPSRTEKLVIVAWPTAFFEETYKIAQNSKYDRDIIFIDYVNDELINKIYSSSKIFVFVSFTEGFGLPLVEAMASGTPVITSDISCMPEVVGDAGLLVNPYDYKDIAQKMATLLSDEKMQNDMIKKGLKRSKLFTWEKTAEATKNIYKKLIEKDGK